MSAVHRALWLAGAPARAALLAAIRLYRATLSGWLGGQCRFYPTCSHYAEDAIRTRGACTGMLLATWRILRCNPFGAGGVDHVPPRDAEYDGIIQPGNGTRA
jgi:putative membrane protein insertion efficiency factor